MPDARKIAWDEQEFVEVRPGVFGATVHTPQLTATLYRYRRGSDWEEHQHPQDQITMVLEGEIEFRVAGDRIQLRAGEAVMIPGGTPHGASIPPTTDASSLNVFTRREAPPDG